MCLALRTAFREACRDDPIIPQQTVHVWGSLRRRDTHGVWSAGGPGEGLCARGPPSLAAPSWSARWSQAPLSPAGSQRGQKRQLSSTPLWRMREAAPAADGEWGGESWGPPPACSHLPSPLAASASQGAPELRHKEQRWDLHSHVALLPGPRQLSQACDAAF